MSKTTEKETTVDMMISLKDVRLSFAQTLFVPDYFKPGRPGKDPATGQEEEKKHRVTFILREDIPGNARQIKDISARIDALAKQELQGKTVPSKDKCLRSGEEKDTDGYGPGTWSLSCSHGTKPTTPKLRLVDGHKRDIDETSGLLYSGCYVNAAGRLWVQNNGWGKRVNCDVLAVQFVRHGEPFGQATIDVEDIFDDVEDEEEDELLG